MFLKSDRTGQFHRFNRKPDTSSVRLYVYIESQVTRTEPVNVGQNRWKPVNWTIYCTVLLSFTCMTNTIIQVKYKINKKSNNEESLDLDMDGQLGRNHKES